MENDLSLEQANHFITGGAGFIGSQLADRLLKEGHKVTVYDNFCTGHMENVTHNLDHKNFKLIKDDLLNFEILKESMKGHDIVWHLAANTNICKGNEITDLDLNNDTVGTRNVLEAMKQLGMNKIMFPSSSTVYGDMDGACLSESVGPLLPISLYGAGKLACEGLISAYSFLFDIKACMFRFGNVVGGRMDHGVIFDFIQKLKKNPKELLILGDGKQRKNFFLIEDCLNGMFTAFKKSEKQFDVFNLGNGSFSEVTQIAQIIIEEMGLKNVELKYTGGKSGWKGDVPVVLYNIDKIKKLGWEPSHSSDEAIRIATQRLLKS